jgi:hypothetical protein
MCFSEEQLDSYAENNADEILRKEIEEHLKTCQGCYAQVTEMTALKRFISQRFGKSEGSHPSPKEIEDFCYGRTDKEKTLGVLEHVSLCDECHELLQEMRAEQTLVQEGKIPQLATPTKLSPRLEASFVKYVIKETANEIVHRRFLDKKEFLDKFWNEILSLAETALPGKSSLVGALGFSELDRDTPEFQILCVIKTLDDFTRKTTGQEDFKTNAKTIRSLAKKNGVRPELVDDIIELTTPYF